MDSVKSCLCLSAIYILLYLHNYLILAEARVLTAMQ